MRVHETGHEHDVAEVNVVVPRRGIESWTDVRDAPLLFDHRSFANGRRRDGKHPARVIARHDPNAPVRDPWLLGS